MKVFCLLALVCIALGGTVHLTAPDNGTPPVSPVSQHWGQNVILSVSVDDGFGGPTDGSITFLTAKTTTAGTPGSNVFAFCQGTPLNPDTGVSSCAFAGFGLDNSNDPPVPPSLKPSIWNYDPAATNTWKVWAQYIAGASNNWPSTPQATAFLVGTVTITPAETYILFTPPPPAEGIQGTSFKFKANIYQKRDRTTALTPTEFPSGRFEFYEGATLLYQNGFMNVGTIQAGQDPDRNVIFNEDGSVNLGPGPHLIHVKYVKVNEDWNLESEADYLVTLKSASTVSFTGPNNLQTKYGDPITLTVNVRPSPNPNASPKPTGTVIFKDNGVVIGQGTVDANGVATLVTTALGTGQHDISADYQGDGTYLPSSSPSGNGSGGGPHVDVSKADTTISLQPDFPHASAGGTVDFTATVTGNGNAGAGGTPASGGVVTFLLDGQPVGTANVVNGVAQLPITFPTAGNHVVTANYGGSNNENGSSVPVGFTVDVVNAPVTPLKGISLTRAPAKGSLVYGQPISFSATFGFVDNGNGFPTGLVGFYRGKTSTVLLGTAPIANVGGKPVATLKAYKLLPVGNHSVVAKFLGGANGYGPSTFTNKVAVQVKRARTVIDIFTTSNNPSERTEPTTLHVHVKAKKPSQVQVNGVVRVLLTDGVDLGVEQKLIGKIVLQKGGKGDLIVDSLHVGLHNITAHFDQNNRFKRSAKTISHRVIPVVPIFEKYTNVKAGTLKNQSVTHSVDGSKLVKAAQSKASFSASPDYAFGPNKGGKPAVVTYGSNLPLTITFAAARNAPTLVYAYKWPPGVYSFSTTKVVLRSKNKGIPDPKNPGNFKQAQFLKPKHGFRELSVPGGDQSTFSGIIEVAASVKRFTIRKQPKGQTGPGRFVFYTLATRGGSHLKPK